MKKWVIIGIGALVAVVLIGATSVYYIVGLANRATYKRQTQALLTETFEALDKTSSGGTSQTLAAFKQLKADSKDAAEKLVGRSAPRGAQELKADAVQIVDLAADLADRGILMFTYIEAVDKVIKRWSDSTAAAPTGGDPAAKLTAFLEATEKANADIKELKPPTSLVVFHLDLTDLLGEMTAKLGPMAAAADAGDAEKLQALSEEWDKLATRVNGLTGAVGKEIADDILPPSDKRKLNRLAREIDNS